MVGRSLDAQNECSAPALMEETPMALRVAVVEDDPRIQQPMAFRPGSGPISSSILKTVRSGELLALNAMEGCGCVRVQGLKPGAAGLELAADSEDLLVLPSRLMLG